MINNIHNKLSFPFFFLFLSSFPLLPKKKKVTISDNTCLNCLIWQVNTVTPIVEKCGELASNVSHIVLTYRSYREEKEDICLVMN